MAVQEQPLASERCGHSNRTDKQRSMGQEKISTADCEDAPGTCEECSRLRAANQALQEQNEVLLSRIADLEDQVARRDRMLEESLPCSRPFEQLPPEILHMIFQRTILPTFLLDCSTALSSDSHWHRMLRQKETLLRVCRSWYYIGLPFLYEDIGILDLFQLNQLVETLENSSHHIENLVKQLTIYTFIPKSYHHQCNHFISRLFDLCPNLVSFSYLSPFEPPKGHIPKMPPNITRLQLSHSVPRQTVDDLFSECSGQLISLSLTLWPISVPPSQQPHSFPRLEELTFELSCRSIGTVAYYTGLWQVPVIHRFIVKLRGNPSHWPTPIPTESLVSFCITKGANIKYFHLHPEYWWSMNNYQIELQPVLEELPSLEHLVLHPRTSGQISHPTVKWIDLWSSHTLAECAKDWETLSAQLVKRHFPRLLSVRSLDSTLANLHTLPSVLPPTSVPDQISSYAFQYLGFHVKHELGAVISVLPEWSDGSEDESWDSSRSVTSSEEDSDWPDMCSDDMIFQEERHFPVDRLPFGDGVGCSSGSSDGGDDE